MGPTFIFTSVCKVGKSTKLFNFIVDEEQNVFKFTPAILQVANLADSQPVTFTEVCYFFEGFVFWLPAPRSIDDRFYSNVECRIMGFSNYFTLEKLCVSFVNLLF